MDMLRIAMLGVAGVFLALLLKSHKPEYSIFLSLSVGIVIFLYAMDKMAVMISYIRQLQSSLPIEGEYVGTILRMIGITYLAEFASNICKDSGCQTIAAGDSHNDLAMIRASKAGFLFRSTEAIKAENPDLPAFDRYDDLLTAIEAALEA